MSTTQDALALYTTVDKARADCNNNNLVMLLHVEHCDLGIVLGDSRDSSIYHDSILVSIS